MTRAVVAMSGGVDSSVAAALLVEQGYDVTGVMLKLWRGDTSTASGCCNIGAAEDARRVADALEIPFYVLNLAERFEDTVIANFHADYAAGRTPNPCVRCNQWIKFDALLQRAAALGADVLATGHYARVRKAEGRFRLLRGVDPHKDQSYVLWMLSQPQLERVLFPVGDLTKPRTRALASSLGLRTAQKPDSQEICFVRAGDLPAYVSRYMPEAAQPGDIVDGAGRPVGEHDGIGRFTVGQRKGLGLSLGAPAYVTAIDASSNRIVIGPKEDLLVAGLVARDVSYTSRAPAVGEDVLVQYRAHGDAAPARVSSVFSGSIEVSFTPPVTAVARGQSAVLYSCSEPDELLGGGYIEATAPAEAVA